MICWRTVLGTTAVVVPVYITLNDKVGHVTRIEGTSMQPLLNPDYQKGKRDWVLLNCWLAREYNFNRGEVVTFVSPNNPRESFIKRIVGLEGDIVRMKKDNDTYIKIPKGHCWVEGENPNRSLDSNIFGPISVSLIRSKATHIVWPPHRWQKLETIEVDSDRVEKNDQQKQFDKHKHIF